MFVEGVLFTKKKTKTTTHMENKKETVSNTENNRLQLVKDKIRTIPDFPKKGILFRDVSTLFKDPVGLRTVIDIFVDHFQPIHMENPIDLIAGVEARGFILGPPIALRLGVL
jgi:adenine/guanine phosphoribosyltransferase-like PRPP-binding protein